MRLLAIPSSADIFLLCESAPHPAAAARGSHAAVPVRLPAGSGMITDAAASFIKEVGRRGTVPRLVAANVTYAVQVFIHKTAPLSRLIPTAELPFLSVLGISLFFSPHDGSLESAPAVLPAKRHRPGNLIRLFGNVCLLSLSIDRQHKDQ